MCGLSVSAGAPATQDSRQTVKSSHYRPPAIRCAIRWLTFPNSEVAAFQIPVLACYGGLPGAGGGVGAGGGAGEGGGGEGEGNGEGAGGCGLGKVGPVLGFGGSPVTSIVIEG